MKITIPEEGFNSEPNVENVGFTVFKFSDTPKPNADNTLIICCFSEFGCEIIGAMYCIPEILKNNKGKYVIVVGWYGREYIYRHLVDEFWEIKPEFMCFRECCKAFHHQSKNLKKIEKSLSKHGNVLFSEYLGRVAVGARCSDCKATWGTLTKVEKCPYCSKTNIRQSIFADIPTYKKNAVKIPKPNKIKQIEYLLGKNPVGVFARSRKLYGRNLEPEFYENLIIRLKNRGYSPIWLGEKQSTLACPCEDIIDFSRMDESRDFEKTLSIVSQCKFTIQFWTASTRLSAITEVPYILFESPDQIDGNGQEGYRLNLVTTGKKKLVLAHYLNVKENMELGLDLAEKAIEEVENGNFEDLFGLLEDENSVRNTRKNSIIL